MGRRGRRAFLAFLAMLAAVAIATAGGSAANPVYTLQILHFYGESGTLADQTAPILGAMVDKFRSQQANTLTLAEGDTWIPGPWLVGGADPSLNAVPGIGSTALARPDVAIMNALGVNASALGNHEFDLGSPVVSGAIAPAAPWVGAQFPFITANLNFAADASLRPLTDNSIGGTAGNIRGSEASAIKGKIAPYAIVTVNGEKIGIVGTTTPDLLTKTSPNGTVVADDGNAATDKLQEAAALLQNAVDALTALGVNKIVEVDQLDDIGRDKTVAPMVSGIDVFVAGGGHERQGDATDTPVAFNGHSANFAETYPVVTAGKDGKPVLIVTTDTEFTYLGRLVVGFDAAGVLDPSTLNTAVNGAYASNEATLQKVYGSAQPASAIVAASSTGSKVKAITGAILAIVTAKDGNKFGFSNVYLEGDRVFARAQETNLGDVTADANTFKARAALGQGAFIVSLKNGGGLRSSIGSIDENGGKVANPIQPGAAGNVSQLDVENALRFDNKLMVFDTTPQGLLNILNYSASLAPGNGGFPQLGGLRWSYDPALPVGSRVRNIALYDESGRQVAKVVQNGAVVPGAPATISVVVLNFTANGGDGYPIKGTANGSNYRFLLTDGTLSAPVSTALDFTAAGVVPANTLGEQKAFEDFLKGLHSTPATAINLPDTTAAQDLRTQNLSMRADAVFDLTKPVITVPTLPVSIEGNAAGGANLVYTVTATDDLDPHPTLTCSAPGTAGGFFALGTTTVNCTATDSAGNQATASFTVKVVDTTKPVITITPPGDRTVGATGVTGATVTWTATALDTVAGGRPVTCAPASGSVFPIGTTTVTCTASDGNGNTATASFKVTVTGASDQLAALKAQAGTVPGLVHCLQQAAQRLAQALSDDNQAEDTVRLYGKAVQKLDDCARKVSNARPANAAALINGIVQVEKLMAGADYPVVRSLLDLAGKVYLSPDLAAVKYDDLRSQLVDALMHAVDHFYDAQKKLAENQVGSQDDADVLLARAEHDLSKFVQKVQHNTPSPIGASTAANWIAAANAASAALHVQEL